MAERQVAQPLVLITQYKWAGQLGPFKIKSLCEECDRTTHSLRVLMENEFKGKDVRFEIKPWLDHALYCLRRGTWHPPIIMLNGKPFFQFSHRMPVFDRDALAREVEILLHEQAAS